MTDCASSGVAWVLRPCEGPAQRPHSVFVDVGDHISDYVVGSFSLWCWGIGIPPASCWECTATRATTLRPGHRNGGSKVHRVLSLRTALKARVRLGSIDDRHGQLACPHRLRVWTALRVRQLPTPQTDALGVDGLTPLAAAHSSLAKQPFLCF